MKSISLVILSLIFSLSLNGGQENGLNDDSNSVEKSFLIIRSSKNYKSALKRARKAGDLLGYKLNLRGMIYSKDSGLTSEEVCGCGEIHGYIPRGRYDDGNYISIEYSSWFIGFAKGYFTVVVSSGDRKELEKILPKIKEHYTDAYIKTTSVYIGCMH